jgi:hypothetical protein
LVWGLSDRIPDAKMVWLFRERLTQTGMIDVLFNRFDTILKNAGYLPMPGQILDATLVEAPKQHNTDSEKADLREGRIPQDWRDKTCKLSHEDRHMRLTLKFTKARRQEGGTMPSADLLIPFFGYKSHVPVNWKFRLPQKWKASGVSDGAELREG